MTTRKASARLSGIKTQWAIVIRAHRGEGDAAAVAQRRLLLRYHRAVFRYLRAIVRDTDAAEELAQDFAVRFLRGDFRSADPARGRFRDLLKGAVRHLAIDHWRRKRVEREAVPARLVGDGPPAPAADRVFLHGWRKEMLAQAWRALARYQARTRRCDYVVLRLRVVHPAGRAAELARLGGARLGRPVSVAAFRLLLRRARRKFADLLVTEVARSLTTADPDAVADELRELDLLDYCRPSLAGLRRATS
jgi:RNA polymerase sigma-70 factor (ECF subfamily)